MTTHCDTQGLDEYCITDVQRELLTTIRAEKTVRAAAEKLGIAERNAYQTLRRIRVNAAKSGWAPAHDMTKTVPEGFGISGVSTLYDKDGEITAQWVKTKRDAEQKLEAVKLFVSELTASITPRKRTKVPKVAQKDLLVGYPIGDHHFGLYAYAAETGGDYDLKIAKQALAAAVDYLVDAAPPAECALLANLGDYLHIDNRSNKTPGSGHILDVDTRYSKVIQVASFGLAHAVNRLLEKHKRIRIVNVPGNHDQDSASWLALVMQAWFKNEPRVEVDMSPAIFLFHQFGANMICMTHGHTIKLPDLPQIMASLQPGMWGDTKYRVGWTGHFHHSQTVIGKENRGAICEQFGVLAPSDSFNASLGYQSQREMHALTFKKSGGILCRATYNADLS